MNIGEMQRMLSLKAEKAPDHKFGDLFGLILRPEWLLQAHDHVARNTGSKTAGCDGIVMSDFDRDMERNMDLLRRTLHDGSYRPLPVRRVQIPKGNGKLRPLGIPSVRDRIAQEALRMALEPIFEADFRQTSYGFRPNRCTIEAIEHVRWYMQESLKYLWIVEGDIASYFDTIHHRRLMKLLRRRVADQKVLDLIWGFLRAGVMERKLFKPTAEGTPQGGIISPLLANVYLHELDVYMEKYTALPQKEKTRRRESGLANFIYVRYADDFVVLCNGTKGQAEDMREELRKFLSDRLKLTLSMEKTKVTHADEGFKFLGFWLERRRRTADGKRSVRIRIPKEAVRKHKERLRYALERDTFSDSVQAKVMALNRLVGGWCRYYQYTSGATWKLNRISTRYFQWLAQWLAGKHRTTVRSIAIRYYDGHTFVGPGWRAVLHSDFRGKRWVHNRPIPNPYTAPGPLVREELLDERPWTGTELREGWMDLRRQIIERDQYTCQWPCCKEAVTLKTARLDHKNPRSWYERPQDADNAKNLWTLCVYHHRIKTMLDRQRESRMR